MEVKINFYCGTNHFSKVVKAISTEVKSISTVVKVNIQGGKNQFPRW